MGAIVREATPGDAPGIARLLGVLMADHGLAPLPVARLIGAAERVMRLPAAWYVVAEGEGQVVGALQLNERYSTWATAPYGYIEDFCVAPAWRRRGVGALLLARVERTARERGWVRVDLDVSTSLTDARRFYERHGYLDTGSVLYRREIAQE